MFPAIAQILMKTLGSMLMSVMTESFFKWFVLWGSEKAVKKTAWKWDDQLHAKIKEQVEED